MARCCGALGDCMTYKVLLALLVLGGCASRPTSYGEATGPFGSKTDETTSVFRGNEHTTSMRTFHYSKLAALESCFNKRLLTFLNETNTVMQPESVQQGAGHQSDARAQALGGSALPATTGKKDVQRPLSTTTFRCVSRVQVLRDVVQMVRVPAEHVAKVMKDQQGGLLVKEAAIGGVLEANDVIVKAFNKRIDREEDLIQQVFFNPQKLERAHLQIVRRGKQVSVSTVVTDISQKMLVLNFYDVQKACAQWKKGEPAIPMCTKTRTDWEKQIPL